MNTLTRIAIFKNSLRNILGENDNVRLLDFNVTKERNRKVEQKKLRNKKLEEYFSIPTLTEILRLDEITDPQEKIKIKYEYIKANPDVEHWDYANYFQSIVHEKKIKENKINGTTRLMKVSTKGNFIWFNEVGVYKYNNICNTGGQYKIIEYNSVAYMTHRFLVSTFIPIPEKLKFIGPKGLFVNHKDAVKGNSELDNLEWVTPSNNILHSVELGAYNRPSFLDHYHSIPIVFKVEIDNLFKGTEFIRIGKKNFGVDWSFSPIIKVLSKKQKLAYGCSCRIAIKEEIQSLNIGVNNKIKEAWSKYPALFNPKLKPVKLESLDGMRSIVLLGENDIKKFGFDPTTIQRCAKRNGVTRNKWKVSYCHIREAHQWLIDQGKLSPVK